jgi:uncharacterized protein (DUF2252 family)
MTRATDDRSATERAEWGRAERHRVPRTSHAQWAPAADRADPLAVIAAQERDRLAWLLPVRHARMAASPFAFFRAGAAVMAADLAPTPTLGVSVQLCGDAHLANFGTYASPERRWVFDVNDFDETLPGPWEWDVKRLGASFVLAARANGLTDPRGRELAVQTAGAYRRAMAGFAQTSTLDTWYARMSMNRVDRAVPEHGLRRLSRSGVRTRIGRRALAKLTERDGAGLRMRSEPPLLVPLRELGDIGADLDRSVRENFEVYLSSVAPDRRHVLGRFRVVEAAVKAVGVGSVGTRCFVLLLLGRDRGEPLFLQIKQAMRSALEPYAPASVFGHEGQRVVAGQRLLQAANDIFLGWSQLESGPHYYWRQFHDTRIVVDVGAMSARELGRYADVCGWTLAHSHARSGDAVTIAAYLGGGTVFDEAIGDFGVAYAAQTEADHARFVAAVG